jgi:sterol desaturase/sphingolipid hydroxylase (fatty acid hydroxylase superfamily)
MVLQGMVLRVLVDGVCFALAFLVASFLEYWIHRLMHRPYKLGQKHRDHHKRGEGQGVLGELRDYLLGGLVVMLLPLGLDVEMGLAWACGGLVFVVFSAYAHQLQHENPRRCFWMAMPVHYVHHKYGMWHHNFGLALDWWDRVFGTYKVVDWLDEKELAKPEKGFAELKWY